MNKSRFRIIFSKAKNMFVAVSENVRSQSKKSGQMKFLGEKPKDTGTSFQQSWQVKNLVICMSLCTAFSPVYANIQVDPRVNPAQQAVIGVGQNKLSQNVPIVNIQTAQNGVSHNVFTQFDVMQSGVVLNNSRAGASSSIIGQVNANPFLNTGEARVILNEVNSSAITQFLGNLEVAGQRADVIIANPSGINIQGGGFINANKGILTTGKPQMNADGSIQKFVIDQGKITINAGANNLGLGGDKNNANAIDIYTRSLELNAQLHANGPINIIAGTNTISADLESIEENITNNTKPALAVDVKALGGMYADSIYMIGTENGLGISNAGTLLPVNNLIITNAGKIENAGTIRNTNLKNGLIQFQTTGSDVNADIINNSGTMYSNGFLGLFSNNNIVLNHTPKQSASVVRVNATESNSAMILSAKGDITKQNGVHIGNYGNGGLFIDANNINFQGVYDQFTSFGDVNVKANGTLTIQTPTLATNNLNFIADKGIDLTSAGLGIRPSLTSKQGSIYLESISSDHKNSIQLNGNTISAAKDFSIYSSGDLNLNNVEFAQENNASIVKNIQLYSDNNLLWDYSTKVAPLFSGEIKAFAGNQLELVGDQLSSKQGIDFQAGQLNIGSHLNSQKSINIVSNKSDLNLNKTLTAQDNIDVSSLNGKLTANSLKATSTAGKISLFAQKDASLIGNDENKVNLNASKGIAIGSIGQGNVNIQKTSLQSNQGGVIVTSEGKNTLTDSTLNAQGNIELFAKDNLTLDGITSTTQQHTALSSKKNININSQVDTAGTPVFTSTKSSQLSAKGILSATSGENQNIQNVKLTGGAVLLEAGKGLNTSTNVTLDSTGSDLLKNNETLNSLNGDLTIQSNNALMIDPRIYTLKATGDIELIAKNGALTLLGYSGSNGNGSEQVVKLNTANGAINVEGTKVELQGSQLNAQQNIKVVSSNGEVTFSGIKSNLLNKQIEKLLIEKNNVKTQADNDYSRFKSTSDFLSYFNEYSNLEKNLNGAKQLLTYAQSSQNGALIKSAFDQVQKYEKELNAIKLKYQKIIDQENKFIRTLEQINADIQFFSQGVNGYEHSYAKLVANTGDINVTSSKGISISGSELTTKVGSINIEAQGPLSQTYISTVKNQDNQPKTIGASIIIDGTQDFYDKGNENDENYRFRTLINPTIINAQKGVRIQTVGSAANDNLVMQGTGIISPNGDINIESNKNILFDAAIEQSYDRAITRETKKSWGGLKKKTITTATENNDVNSASVDLQGKNIIIESKENNPNTSIDIYSGKFIADGGQITIRSGGNLNFYTVEESSSSITDVTKKSSFAGIKYNSSKINATRNQALELPATLKADYIGTKSGFDTRLVGTEFEYLKGAKIESGGKLELIAAKSKIVDLVKTEKNSVVWQSMQDKGSIIETGQLPRFNGPTPPEFKANGGLIVQIPVSEKDQNKVQLRDEILKLSSQQGNEYLKDLIKRNDIDWQKIILEQKDWDYKSQGLTGAGAAIIVIVVAALTYGAGTAAIGTTVAAAPGATTVTVGATTVTVGAGGSATFLGGTLLSTTTAAGAASFTTAGTMLNAALTSLASQASIGLANNGGDISKTLKDLGSKESIKNLVVAVATAGATQQLNAILPETVGNSQIAAQFVNGFTTQTINGLITAGINGNNINLENTLIQALLNSAGNTVQSQLSTEIKIKDLDTNYVLHKILHAAVGCGTAALAANKCESGAIGAAVGEIVADELLAGRNPTFVSDSEKLKIQQVAQVAAGSTAALLGYDVNTAAQSANIAVENNSLKDKAIAKLEATRKYLDDKSKVALDGLIAAYKKGDIKAAQNFKNQLDDSVSSWASSPGGYVVWGMDTKAAVGSMVAVVSDLVIPTNVVEIIPVGKITKVAKIMKVGDDGIKSAAKLKEELAQLQKVDIKIGTTLPGAKAPITVTAETNIGGKHMFDTNQTARPDVNRKNTPTLAAGGKGVESNNPNVTMKNAHAEVALIQRAYDAGLTKGEIMQIVVRGKEVCDHCGQAMKTMYERSGLSKLIIHDTAAGITKTYYKVFNKETKKYETKVRQDPIYGH